MYDEIILDKAVQKAAKNGWNGDIERSGYAPLVFNKDFMRALFGKWPLYSHDGYKRFEKGEQLSESHGDAIEDKDFVTGSISYEAWQYHIMQMSIAPDAIKYLSDHLGEI